MPRGATTVVTNSEAPRNGRAIGALTITSGPDAGRVLSVAVASTIIIGRTDECSVLLNDGSLSRVHARIDYLLGEYVLNDCASRNGSYVNDVRVTGPVRLREGDRVTLGRATTMRFALVTAEEEQAMRGVYEASTRDGLTGVFNRRHTEERLDAEIAFALRHNLPLSVVMLDIDFFKRVNDTLGHAAGDSVLKSTAGIVSGTIRNEDFCGRVGGEEFLVVLRATALGGAMIAAERLRSVIETTLIPTGGRMTRITASFGVASLTCSPQVDRAAILAAADARLYQAKNAGRNRVVGS